MQSQRRQIAPVDRFRARLFAGEETALKINAIIKRHGWTVGNKQQGHLTAIAAAERIYMTFGPDRLDDVLGIVTESLAGEGDVPSATLLDGVNAFISRYEHLMDRSRLVRSVRASGQDRINRNTTAIKELMRESAGKACGRVLLSIYNHKLQTRRLPDWDSVTTGDLISKTRKAKQP
jgi:hypothetical protein